MAVSISDLDWRTRVSDALRAHGLDDAMISDAIQVIAYFNYINRVAEGVGTDPEPEWEGS